VNVRDVLSSYDVQSTVKYLRDRDLVMDDVRCFDQFCNLKTFVERAQNDEDFRNVAVRVKWVKYCRKNCNADSHPSCLK
jgi:hypothetical protein